MEKIAFVGLGNMGLPMAQLLLNAGYSLQVFNRTKEKARQLSQQNLTVCNTPKEAAKDCKIIVTMLADDAILNDAVSGDNGFLSTLKEGTVHISMSTIAPETSQHMATVHAKTGAHYLAAPVFGRPDAAAAKKLWICVSGQTEIKQKVKHVLEAMCQGVVDFGEEAGAANAIKIIGNFMILSSLEMMGEAFTLGEKFGIERSTISQFFGDTVFNAPIYKNYGKLIAERNFENVGFKSRWALKDIRLALALADKQEMPMPLAALVHSRLLSGLANDLGDRDMTEVFEKGISKDAGL